MKTALRLPVAGYVLLLLAALAPPVHAQFFFPAGDDLMTYDRDGGSNGRDAVPRDVFYVGDMTGVSSFFFVKPLVLRSGGVTDTKNGIGIVFFMNTDGVLDFVPVGDFEKLLPKQGEGPWSPATIDGQAPPGIPISNSADTFDLTCDGRFAVVAGSNSATPVSLVDLGAGTEVDTFAYNGVGSFVAACDDRQSVLVLFDGSQLNTSVIRRLTVAASGTLHDTGEAFTIPGSNTSISKVFAVPGSQTGLALTFELNPSRRLLVSFGVPGLQMLDSVQISGFDDVSAAVSCAGDKVYVRSNNLIEAFSYDPVTGALGDTASLTINNVSPAFIPNNFGNALAISRDGSRLIAPEQAQPPTPEVPSPQVTYFDAVTGARLGKFEGPQFVTPALVSTVACCRPLSAARLLNISTRMRVQTGDNVLIGGFIITGSDPKRVIIRGIGPSLSSFIPGALADPSLELFQGSTLLAMNDNWKTDQQAEIEATGVPPSNDLESAIVQTLVPGAYTMVMRGNGDMTGIGVVEAYDLDQPSDSKLANVSTRGFVETGDNVMIGGVIIGSPTGTSAEVVVRAIGPTLGNFGIPGALQDPTLDLVNSNGVVIRSNNDWRESQQTEIMAVGLQPSDDRESALLEIIVPGNYTAIVRGVASTTGVGLVEAYQLQ